jgi:sialic acid synthase SpsE
MKNNNKVIVIAEAGVNHNGSIKKALKMIDVAAQSGADFVKFQTFEPFALTDISLGLANYQKKFNYLDLIIVNGNAQ